MRGVLPMAEYSAPMLVWVLAKVRCLWVSCLRRNRPHGLGLLTVELYKRLRLRRHEVLWIQNGAYCERA